MVCEKFKTHSQNECKYNYMAMISINHTKNILKIPLFYYTHMVISGLCEQVNLARLLRAPAERLVRWSAEWRGRLASDAGCGLSGLIQATWLSQVYMR